MAFLVCREFCGESGLRKVCLGGIHPLTQRYMLKGNFRNG
ncbi:Cation transport ATPase [Vibrio vulnificus]|nr:Cation transport ATPase [Vibrio vulnificus]